MPREKSLTGRCAYDGESWMAKLLAHRDAEIPSLQSANDEVPEWIETVFRKMVAKRRSDRYQSMTEVIRALESGQGGSSVNMSIPRMPALYFWTSTPSGQGKLDIWFTQRKALRESWSTPSPLPAPLNTASHEGPVWISPDEKVIVLLSDRPGGFGARDLWVATRSNTSEKWSQPLNMGPMFNTPSLEDTADISPDGRTIWLHQMDRPDGYGISSLWQSRRVRVK